VFAHNGDIQAALSCEGPYQPEGNTDSEAAFCWMLNALDRRFAEPADGHSLFPWLVEHSQALASQGIFNCLISNGEWLYVYGGTRLHTITRRAPFTTATLADDDVTVDFSAVTTIHDVVTIVSTEPLTTNECWRQLEPGEALLLQLGEVTQRRLARA
jgi:glutamine amidotransferase